MDDYIEQRPSPLKPVKAAWMDKIGCAIKHKQKQFQNDADECMRFLDGGYRWMFDDENLNLGEGRRDEESVRVAAPAFQMNVNKAAELRDLLGPMLYHQNPKNIVDPIARPMIPPESLGIVFDPMNPMDPVLAEYQSLAEQERVDAVRKGTVASLIQHQLNYFQRENDKKRHMRLAVDEGLIKGAGVLWIEIVETDGFVTKTIGSFYDTIDNLFMDPDATCMEDVQWIARRCVHPIWQVEDEYNLPAGSLRRKGTHESHGRAAENTTDPKQLHTQAVGETNDLLTYYKVYSKMGFGGRLKNQKGENIAEELELLGDFCYLVVCDGIDYPLNLPPDLVPAPEMSEEGDIHEFRLPRVPVMEQQPVLDVFGQPMVDPITGEPTMQEVQAVDPETGEPMEEVDEQVFLAAQWPVPYWGDNRWPMRLLAFHEKPGQLWPISHLKPAIGELRFINWAMSFLATKVQKSCITKVAVKKAVSEQLKLAISSGVDYELLEIDAASGEKIQDIISFLEHPDINVGLWNVINAVQEMFDKRTGLNEILYGEMKGARSATEAQARQTNMAIRPDDMANKVEDFLSEVARGEAMAMRWFLERKDVEPVLGPLGAMVWEQQVMSSDIESVVREFHYRIEAGSARKPNNANKAAIANEALQVASPAAMQYATAFGDYRPLNALFQNWAKANDTTMPEMVPPPPPPMQEAPPEEEQPTDEPPPEEQGGQSPFQQALGVAA